MIESMAGGGEPSPAILRNVLVNTPFGGGF